MFKQKYMKKKCLKKYFFKKKNKKKTFFPQNIPKMKYHQFTSNTEPALNDSLWLICRETKQN